MKVAQSGWPAGTKGLKTCVCVCVRAGVCVCVCFSVDMCTCI